MPLSTRALAEIATRRVREHGATPRHEVARWLVTALEIDHDRADAAISHAIRCGRLLTSPDRGLVTGGTSDRHTPAQAA